MRLHELLWATIHEKVAEPAELSHEAYTSVLKYNDENYLSCAIAMAYFTAPAYYNVIRALSAGKGFADIAMVTRADAGNKPAIPVELKYNQSADTALRQIRGKRYAGALKDFGGRIILAGICYDKTPKRTSVS